MTCNDIIQALRSIYPEYELLSTHQNVILWAVSRATFTHADWSKITRSSISEFVTIRNANTIRKIISLSKALINNAVTNKEELV